MNDEFDQFLFGNGVVQILNKTPDAPILNGARTLPPYKNQIKKEYPVHRLICELAAAGYTCKEIASITGRSAVSIQDTLRQPILQQTLANAVHAKAENIDREVLEVIKRNVLVAAKYYENNLNDPNVERKYKSEAAAVFLERRYGKANQPVNRSGDVDLNVLSIAELAAELPRTESTGTSTNPPVVGQDTDQ